MRVAIDYTSGLRQRGGVGRYTRSLVEALCGLTAEDELLLWYTRDCDGAPPAAPNVSSKRLPVSSRWLTAGWQRLRIPVPLERLIGPADVAHAPDFVVPPGRAPSIATIHDLSYLLTPEYAHPDLRRYLETAVPRTLRRAARVVAVSDTTRRDLIERYGLDERRVVAIHNGVDQRFAPPPREEVEAVLRETGIDQPYFVAVGTIEPRKNHLTLLRAFEDLHQSHPEAHLVIAGQPAWLAEPIVEAIELASGRLPIRYLRHLDDRWLPAVYAGSVALVYPSWYEGFGLPALEAMASRTAVIVSDRGALPEVVGDAALITPADRPDALADAMRKLLEQPSTRDCLIARGGLRAAEFSWERAARRTLEIYREVVA